MGNVESLSESKYWLRCVRSGCGFIVGENYFREKPQFQAGVCPRCGSKVGVVTPYEQSETGLRLDLKTGKVV